MSVTSAIEWVIKKNDSIRIGFIPWILTFYLYWMSTMIFDFAIIALVNQLCDYYNVEPSKFSVLLFNMAVWIQVMFAIYILVFTLLTLFEYRRQ